MTRNEIRRRALRAAAAVSLTVGVFGCSNMVVVDADQGAGGGGGAGGDDAVGEGGSAPLPSTTTTSGDPVADAGTDPTPDAMADGGADGGVDCTQAADYAACCEENNWDFGAGCMAWGPPMPPAMGVA